MELVTLVFLVTKDNIDSETFCVLFKGALLPEVRVYYAKQSIMHYKGPSLLPIRAKILSCQL